MLKADILLNLNYNGENLAKLKRSLQLVELTFNSDRFKNAVLNFSMPDGKMSFHFKTYKPRLIGRKEIRQKEYLNEEVLKMILNGQSGTGDVRYMNFKVELLPGEGGTKADAENDGDIIYTYEGELKRMNDARFAAHLAHEYCHIIGFSHSEHPKCDELGHCYSVPYAIENMVEIILTGINRDKCAYHKF